MQEDRCGVCGGNGDQCNPLTGVFNASLPENITEGYVMMLTLPARARHIRIQELTNSPHFLSLAAPAINGNNKPNFYVNGDNLISMPGEFVVAGAETLYTRDDELETIEITQPINEPISLYVKYPIFHLIYLKLSFL